MSRPLPCAPAGAALRLEYVHADDPRALLREPDVLAALGFGRDAPHHDDPRYLRVPLQPHGAAPYEVWHANAPVRSGRDGDLASFFILIPEQPGTSDSCM